MNPKPVLVPRAMRLALAFLTIVPVRFPDGAPTERDLAASRVAFPFVGVLIGLILAGLSQALTLAGVGPHVSAIAIIACGVVVTGCLHLDGVADSCDGLFMPRGDAERRLEVMRDSHVGTFGVVGIVLVLLGKYSALIALAEQGRTEALFTAIVVARTLVLVSAGISSSARPDGMGRIFIEAAGARDAALAGIAVLVVGAAVIGPAGLIACTAALASAWLVTRIAIGRIGGTTGDTLGAVIEFGELTLLSVLTAF